jgi:hypothetical protein
MTGACISRGGDRIETEVPLGVLLFRQIRTSPARHHSHRDGSPGAASPPGRDGGPVRIRRACRRPIPGPVAGEPARCCATCLPPRRWRLAHRRWDPLVVRPGRRGQPVDVTGSIARPSSNLVDKALPRPVPSPVVFSLPGGALSHRGGPVDARIDSRSGACTGHVGRSGAQRFLRAFCCVRGTHVRRVAEEGSGG